MTINYLFLQGAGTSEGALINVLVGGTKQDIAEIKDAYTKSKMQVFYANQNTYHKCNARGTATGFIHIF